MNPAPHPELPAYLAHHWPAYLDLLHQMVLINSFTLNPGGVNRLGTLTAERFAELGFEAEAVPAAGFRYGKHLLLSRPATRENRVTGGAPTIGLISVSYTHLDVYKRQG